jgi:hypothetical protein
MARVYGSNIPQARDRLLALAEEIKRASADDLFAPGWDFARKIQAVVEEDMHQRKNAAPRGHYRNERSVTEAEWAEVRRLYYRERMPQQRIAERLGINAGRISEHLARWQPERRRA